MSLMNSRTTAANRFLYFLAQGMLTLTFFCTIVAWSPFTGTDEVNLDVSWIVALNQAVAQGMAFGRDIVFPLGPYAAVLTKVYHPATDFRMICAGLILATGYAVLFFHLLWRRPWWLLMLTSVVLAMLLRISMDMALLLYPFLTIWLLSGMVTGRESFLLSGMEASMPEDASDHIIRGRYQSLLYVLLLIPFGLLPLIKGNMLVLCGGSSFLLLILLACLRRWRLFFLSAVVPVITMIAFWLFAGQRLSDLPHYLYWMRKLISGFTEAMAWSGPVSEIILYLCSAVIGVGAVMLTREERLRYRLWRAILLCFVLFVFFKSAFVRHDGHALGGFTALLLISWLLCVEYVSRWKCFFLLCSAVVWIWVCSMYLTVTPKTLLVSWYTTYTHAIKGLVQRVMTPDALPDQYNASMRELADKVAFPYWQGGADIYSYGQIYLIASGNHWNPRPVFQSYHAYTPELAALNTAHLSGEKAPEHIVFSVEPIDGRLPALEDGPSWPLLLTDYQPDFIQNQQLFLYRRNAVPQASWQPEPVLQRTAHLNEPVAVPQFERMVFAKLVVRPNMAGRLMNALYKNVPLQIVLQLSDGRQQVFHVLSGMLEAGFLLSPLVTETREFAMLYGNDISSLPRVDSLVLRSAGKLSGWQDAYEVRFYPMPDTQPVTVELMDFFGRKLPFDKSTLPGEEKCYGNVDALNGQPVGQETNRITGGVLSVSGWLASDSSAVSRRVVIILKDQNDNRLFFSSRQLQREDVQAYYNKADLLDSGFDTVIDLSEQYGQYQLSLGFETEGRVTVCSGFNIPLHIDRAQAR